MNKRKRLAMTNTTPAPLITTTKKKRGRRRRRRRRKSRRSGERGRKERNRNRREGEEERGGNKKKEEEKNSNKNNNKKNDHNVSPKSRGAQAPATLPDSVPWCSFLFFVAPNKQQRKGSVCPVPNFPFKETASTAFHAV